MWKPKFFKLPTTNLLKWKSLEEMYLMSSSLTYKKESVDFVIFTSIFVALQYRSVISLRFITSLLKPLQNKRTSSTNKKLVRDIELPILIPFRVLVLVSSINTLLSPSTNNNNRRGEWGNPSLNLLLGLKKFEANPLIKMEMETNITHDPIINLQKNTKMNQH